MLRVSGFGVQNLKRCDKSRNRMCSGFRVAGLGSQIPGFMFRGERPRERVAYPEVEGEELVRMIPPFAAGLRYRAQWHVDAAGFRDAWIDPFSGAPGLAFLVSGTASEKKGNTYIVFKKFHMADTAKNWPWPSHSCQSSSYPYRFGIHFTGSALRDLKPEIRDPKRQVPLIVPNAGASANLLLQRRRTSQHPRRILAARVESQTFFSFP